MKQTTKVLLDPILTAKPSGCSTNVQFYTLVKYVLEDLKRTDVFFYWRVPTWVTDEEMEWYPNHPNVRYVRCEQHTSDRVQEYFKYSSELERDTSFFGDLWDADIVITVRSSLIALMKMKQNSPRTHTYSYVKQVWLIEEMPMFAFKGTVPVTDEVSQEIQTLAGYIAADRVWIMSYHEIRGIFDSARKYLSATSVRSLIHKIKPVVPVQVKTFCLKDASFFSRSYDEAPFTIAFVGRMEKTQAQLEDVNDTMLKQWIMKGNKVRLVAASVSRTTKVFDENLVECKAFPREEFWRVMKEDAHVVLSLSKEMGFSLSLLEPMMLGTPAIVLRRPYAEAMLGNDYPFYVKGKAEALGMLEHFYQNYSDCYARFMEWFVEWFRPTYEKRFSEDLMYPLIVAAIDDYQAMMLRKYEPRKDNAILQLIAEAVQGKDRFTFSEVIAELGESGKLEALYKKDSPEFKVRASLPWLPTWNEYRLGLKYGLGWEDASPIVGEFKKGETL